MLNFMKIEIKTNASAATHIRLEERKSLHRARTWKIVSDREEETEQSLEDKEKAEKFYSLYQNLHHRRVHELRKKQRLTYLAYGFLRGIEYSDIEELAYTLPDMNEVEKIVFKHIDSSADPRDVKQRFEEWAQLAKSYYKDES